MTYTVLKNLDFKEQKKQLQARIDALGKDASLPDDLGRKKALILNRALDNQALAKISPAPELLGLAASDLNTYKVDNHQKLAYLATTPWTGHPITIPTNPTGTPTRTRPSQMRRLSRRISPTFISAAACLAQDSRRKR